MKTPDRFILGALAAAVLSTTAFGQQYEYAWSNFVGQAGGLGHSNGTGAAAQFVFPSGVAADGSGNVYVADTTNEIIRKITAAGVVSTIAGTAGVTGTSDGVGQAAQFNLPSGIAVDGMGNIYVADTGNDTIRKIDSTGNVITIAGSPGVSGTADGAPALFNSPAALAVNASGAVYVADTANDTIRVISSGGIVTTVAGSPGTSGTANGIGSAAGFNAPGGIVVNATNSTLYIADTGNNTIRLLTSGGTVTTIAGKPAFSGTTDGAANAALFNHPAGLAVDSLGNVYVADSVNDTIRLITGTTVSTFAGKPTVPGHANGAGAAAQFANPTSLAIGAGGYVYVADTNNSTIRKITSNASVSTFAGSATIAGHSNGTGAAASFNAPGAAADRLTKTLYIADTANNIIRKVTAAGVVSTFAGTAGVTGTADGAGASAQFNAPSGIAVDGSGNIYVADTGNNTIRTITSTGVVSTIAGKAGVSGTNDALTGNSARFNKPQGIGVDPNGIVYVADTDNNTIRIISTSGSVGTLAGAPGVSGTDDGAGSAALFAGPQSLAVDGTSAVYVADTLNETVRQLLPNGVVSTFAGRSAHSGSSDGKGTARFNGPEGIAVDNAHTLFVVDTLNSTIRSIATNGAVTTIGGTAGLLGSLSGAGNAATFAMPQGIACTPDGSTLYVVDTFNNRITKGVPTPFPVLTLEQPPGTVLSPGSGVDFGTIVTGSAAVRQFEIVNMGSAPLLNLSVVTGGSSAAEFHATPLASGSLAIGGMTNFTVTCAPAGFGPVSANLQIGSNDPVRPNFTVALTASGTSAPGVNLTFAAGTFVGLLGGTSAADSDYAMFSVTSTGLLTGHLLLDGASVAVKGSFDANGNFTASPGSAPVAINLISGAGGLSNSSGYQIEVSSTGAGATLLFAAQHAAYSSKQVVTESPRYTLLLESGTNPAIPQGVSYATLIVAKAGGRASLSGKLSDGAPFTFSGLITNGGLGHQFLIFDPGIYSAKAYAGTGLLTGVITFEQLTTTDCDGTLRWVRPPTRAVNGTLYPQGFDTGLNANGAIYLTPGRNISPIPFISGSFTLSEGSLPAPASALVFLYKGALYFPGSNPDNISVKLNVMTGAFSGSFIHPLSGKPTPFSGLLYQNPNSPGAGGFFIGPVINGAAASGAAMLTH